MQHRPIQLGHDARTSGMAGRPFTPHGLEFTVNDLQECADASELSDAELELVAGGGRRGTNFPKATSPPRAF